MAITQVWRVSVIGLGPSGEGIVNTFHYGPDGTDDAHDAIVVAADFDGSIVPVLAGLVTTDWHYLKTTVLCLHGANVGKSAENADSAPLAGSLAAPSAPLTVAAIERRIADSFGRHSRGRIFVSPIPQSSVEVNGAFTPPGTWAADAAGLVKDSVNADGDTMFPCLWDQVHTQAIIVLRGVTGKLIGVQRRRRLRQPN